MYHRLNFFYKCLLTSQTTKESLQPQWYIFFVWGLKIKQKLYFYFCYREDLLTTIFECQYTPVAKEIETRSDDEGEDRGETPFEDSDEDQHTEGENSETKTQRMKTVMKILRILFTALI